MEQKHTGKQAGRNIRSLSVWGGQAQVGRLGGGGQQAGRLAGWQVVEREVEY